MGAKDDVNDDELERRRGGTARKILVVEDSPSARKLLQALLLRLGVTLPELRLASTVGEALQTFTHWRPDIVFVDLQLRGPPDPATPANDPPPANLPKNGAELAIQMIARHPGVKIVVCSASEPSQSPIGDLVRQGRVHTIVKPILAARLKEVLEATAGPVAPAPRRR